MRRSRRASFPLGSRGVVARPAERLGLRGLASLVGLAFSPVLAGFVGASGLRVVFVVDIVLLIALEIVMAFLR